MWWKILLCFASLWPKILDSWQHGCQKHKWRYAKEVINYFYKFRIYLYGNNCTRASQTKNDPGRVVCTVLVTIPWAGPSSVIGLHSIDNQRTGSKNYEFLLRFLPQYYIQATITRVTSVLLAIISFMEHDDDDSCIWVMHLRFVR